MDGHCSCRVRNAKSQSTFQALMVLSHVNVTMLHYQYEDQMLEAPAFDAKKCGIPQLLAEYLSRRRLSNVPSTPMSFQPRARMWTLTRSTVQYHQSIQSRRLDGRPPGTLKAAQCRLWRCPFPVDLAPLGVLHMIYASWRVFLSKALFLRPASEFPLVKR